MTDLVQNILISAISTVGGIIIGLVVDGVKTRYKFRQELRDNNHIDVTGDDWYAAWQTSVENTLNLNTEHLQFIQKGQTVKIKNLEKAPENPKGGYLWTAQLQFFHGKSLMGWYFPIKKENLTSQGILFLAYQSTKRIFIGKWVGSSYDGDLSNGFVVISKDRDASLSLLREVMEKHTDKVNIIYNTL